MNDFATLLSNATAAVAKKRQEGLKLEEKIKEVRVEDVAGVVVPSLTSRILFDGLNGFNRSQRPLALIVNV